MSSRSTSPRRASLRSSSPERRSIPVAVHIIPRGMIEVRINPEGTLHQIKEAMIEKGYDDGNLFFGERKVDLNEQVSEWRESISKHRFMYTGRRVVISPFEKLKLMEKEHEELLRESRRLERSYEDTRAELERIRLAKSNVARDILSLEEKIDLLKFEISTEE